MNRARDPSNQLARMYFTMRRHTAGDTSVYDSAIMGVASCVLKVSVLDVWHVIRDAGPSTLGALAQRAK